MPVTYTCDRCGTTCPTHGGDFYPRNGKNIDYFAGPKKFVCETCFTDYIRFFNNWWKLPRGTRDSKFMEIGLDIPFPDDEMHHLSEKYGVSNV